jgi:beta-galactosidase
MISRKVIGKNLYYARWEIPYKAGKVQAIGYKNGKKVTEHFLQTAVTAVALRINANKKNIVADGEDILLFEISLVDKNGVVDPEAGNEITVNVSGGATLIGLDNGSQLDTTAFKSNTRKAFGGRLLVTVQATGKQGNVILKLRSPDLENATFTLKAISPFKN